MGKIVVVVEEKCGDCQESMGETSYETENLDSDPKLDGSRVKRQIKFKRCKKCQPIFEGKMQELKKAGLVQVIPFGQSGQKKEVREVTLRDFVGRERNKLKKEART